MRSFNVKLVLLVALFVALVAKGGQLCSPGGVQAMTRFVEKERIPTVEPLPLRPIEEEFRGVSPLPDLVERAAPHRGVVKVLMKPAAKKSAKSPAASPAGTPAASKDTPKKPPKKS